MQGIMGWAWVKEIAQMSVSGWSPTFLLPCLQTAQHVELNLPCLLVGRLQSTSSSTCMQYSSQRLCADMPVNSANQSYIYMYMSSSPTSLFWNYISSLICLAALCILHYVYCTFQLYILSNVYTVTAQVGIEWWKTSIGGCIDYYTTLFITQQLGGLIHSTKLGLQCIHCILSPLGTLTDNTTPSTFSWI